VIAISAQIKVLRPRPKSVPVTFGLQKRGKCTYENLYIKNRPGSRFEKKALTCDDSLEALAAARGRRGPVLAHPGSPEGVLPGKAGRIHLVSHSLPRAEISAKLCALCTFLLCSFNIQLLCKSLPLLVFQLDT